MVIIAISMGNTDTEDRQSRGARMPQARGTKVRSTRQAASVIAAMSGMPAFSGARDIHAALRRHGERVGLATVYRHLRVLAERGQVDTIRAGGETLYRLRGSSVKRHLVCRACGCCVEVDGSEVEEWAEQVAAQAGYILTRSTVELSGLCPACTAYQES
jgi:Fur family ferric uptake transcriptional regulator